MLELFGSKMLGPSRRSFLKLRFDGTYFIGSSPFVKSFGGWGGSMKLLRMCRSSCSALGKQPGVLIGCTADVVSKKSCTNLRLVLVFFLMNYPRHVRNVR